MQQYIVLVGVAVGLYGAYHYIRDTIKGETKPNRVTWLMWSLAPLIATAAALSKGVSWAVVPVFMSGFGPFLVLVASFFNKQSYWELTKFDYLCGLFSLLALVLWGITKEPMIAIIFAIISDGFAALPTLIKAWKYPETETVEAYTTGLLNALTAFFAIKLWIAPELAFPIYLVIMNSLLIFSVSKGKLKTVSV